VLHTQHCAAFDAKSRVALPEKLPAEFGALLPLFGDGKEVTDTAAATSAPSSAPTPSSPELLDKLSDVIGDLETALVTRYLVANKRIPEGGSLSNLTANQVDWIINHAATFRARVEKFANEPF
jgi:hypothetical protein